jgi:hypothetical protein
VDRAKGRGTQRAKCKSGDSDPSGRELSPSAAADDCRPQRTRRRPACGWPPASGRGASRGSGLVHRRTFHQDALGPLADPPGCSRCCADTSVTQLSDRAIGRRPERASGVRGRRRSLLNRERQSDAGTAVTRRVHLLPWCATAGWGVQRGSCVCGAQWKGASSASRLVVRRRLLRSRLPVRASMSATPFCAPTSALLPSGCTPVIGAAPKRWNLRLPSTV